MQTLNEQISNSEEIAFDLADLVEMTRGRLGSASLLIMDGAEFKQMFDYLNHAQQLSNQLRVDLAALLKATTEPVRAPA